LKNSIVKNDRQFRAFITSAHCIDKDNRHSNKKQPSFGWLFFCSRKKYVALDAASRISGTIKWFQWIWIAWIRSCLMLVLKDKRMFVGFKGLVCVSQDWDFLVADTKMQQGKSVSELIRQWPLFLRRMVQKRLLQEIQTLELTG
jgi:hypothetical protein